MPAGSGCRSLTRRRWSCELYFHEERQVLMPRRTITVPCGKCGVQFQKLWNDYRRCKNHYCSRDCSLASFDHVEAGRKGGLAAAKVPVDPEVAAARARLGGLARTRNLTPERLREISRLGVEARLRKLSPEERSAIGRRSSATLRFGPLVVFGVRVGKQ